MQIIKYPNNQNSSFYKRTQILLLATIFFSQQSVADDMDVRLIGNIDFHYGYYNDIRGTASVNKKDVAFNSSSSIAALVENTNNSIDMKYGAQIALNTSEKSSRAMSSNIYVSSARAGKLEFGSAKSVYATMKIHGYTNACGTAGGWDIWTATDPVGVRGLYTTNFGNFLDPKSRQSEQIEYSRKITYYTPKIGNLQFGISYIPDTTNIGSKSIHAPEYHDILKTKKYEIDIKDGVAIGVTHSYKVNKDLQMRFAAVGEVGTPVQKQGTNIQNIKWKKLRTYTIGTEVSYKNMVISGAYMNYMKSITSDEVDTNERNTYLYGATARYNHNNKLSYSLSNFFSKHKGNQLNATTFALNYHISHGIMSYAEATYCKVNGQYKMNNKITNDKNIAKVFIVGTRVTL